jgi:hypothetical protein
VFKNKTKTKEIYFFDSEFIRVYCVLYILHKSESYLCVSLNIKLFVWVQCWMMDEFFIVFRKFMESATTSIIVSNFVLTFYRFLKFSLLTSLRNVCSLAKNPLDAPEIFEADYAIGLGKKFYD